MTAEPAGAVADVAPPAPSRARRDALAVVAITAAVAIASVALEGSEHIAAFTRLHERWQLDELPGVLLALAAALAWFAWRRALDARREVAYRRVVESQLAVTAADNRRLSRALVKVQEDEWRDIARELHDELGQSLVAVKLDACEIGAVTPDAEVRRAATAIRDASDTMLSAVRSLTRRLRPPGLDELGLIAALEECVAGFRRRLPATLVTLEVDDSVSALGEAANITFYRIVQEGLTNVARHARAHRVTIRIVRLGASGCELAIEDDGDGIATPRPMLTGVGLIGMRERVVALGGDFSAGPRPDGGFAIRARIAGDTVQR